MALSTAESAIVLLVVGALVGAVPTFLLELDRRRHTLKTRWDSNLFDLASAFAASGRNLLHLSERLSRSPDPKEQLDRIDSEHRALRSLSEQIRLLGSKQMQAAAELVVHHAYSVRRVGQGEPDKYAEIYELSPHDRFRAAEDDFYRACRHQFGVKDPDEVFRAPRESRTD